MQAAACRSTRLLTSQSTTSKQQNAKQVVAGDGQGVPVGRISREDVASLCVAALESAKASHATLSCVSTTAQKPDRKGSKAASAAPAATEPKKMAGPGSGDTLFPYKLILRREGRPDETPLRRKPHRLAVSVFLLALSAAAVGFAAVAAQVVAFVAARLRCVSLLWGSGGWCVWCIGDSMCVRVCFLSTTPPQALARERGLLPLAATAAQAERASEVMGAVCSVA